MQNTSPLSSLNAFNVISIITNLLCHYKIIRNEGLFLPAENSFRPKFVTLLKEGGTSQVQKPCFIPPKIILFEVHFGSEKSLGLKKILGLKENLGLKKFWFQEKILA